MTFHSKFAFFSLKKVTFIEFRAYLRSCRSISCVSCVSSALKPLSAAAAGGAAASLVAVGGILVYSTCTLSAEENEEIVAYALRGCAVPLRLLPPPAHLRLGSVGWAGCGLSRDECERVQRFDPSTDETSIGFFVAKFERVPAGSA